MDRRRGVGREEPSAGAVDGDGAGGNVVVDHRSRAGRQDRRRGRRRDRRGDHEAVDRRAARNGGGGGCEGGGGGGGGGAGWAELGVGVGPPLGGRGRVGGLAVGYRG